MGSEMCIRDSSSTMELATFGSLVQYRIPNTQAARGDKYAPTSSPGIFLGTVPNGAAKVLDMEQLQQSHRILVRQTSHYKEQEPIVFPFHDASLHSDINGIENDIFLHFPKCTRCSKPYMASQPVLCHACRGKHRSHSHQLGWCMKARCQCDHPDTDKGYDLNWDMPRTQSGGEPCLLYTSPSPRDS